MNITETLQTVKRRPQQATDPGRPRGSRRAPAIARHIPGACSHPKHTNYTTNQLNNDNTTGNGHDTTSHQYPTIPISHTQQSHTSRH